MMMVALEGPDYWPVVMLVFAPGCHSCEASPIFAAAYLAPPGHSDYFVIANSYYSSNLPFTSLSVLSDLAFYLLYSAWRVWPGRDPVISFPQKRRSARTVSRIIESAPSRFLTYHPLLLYIT